MDFFDDSTKFLKRAKNVAEELGAELELLHVIDYIPGLDAVAGVPTGLLVSMQDLEDSAKANLRRLTEKAGLSPDQCHVAVGPVAARVVEHAVDAGADLVLVGGHGRHGFKALLGSTANAVLNRATLDVLVIRLGD